MTRAQEALARRLGHGFARPELLTRALTHRAAASYAFESNERLEFLGDRVLALVMARLLHDRFPEEQEGDLSRRFQALVRREALVRVAERIGLGPALKLGRDDDRSHPTLLADGCEAVIGALYLDGGLEVAASFIAREWENLIAESAEPPTDARTALQELVQGRGKKLPEYDVLRMEGPDHAPRFTVRVTVSGGRTAEGEGASKQAASEAAAKAMLARLKNG